MITTQIPEDYPLLVGLQQSDSSSIKAIYDLALPSVIHWVKENKGTEADGRDIFQEALIALYRRLKVSTPCLLMKNFSQVAKFLNLFMSF